MRVLAAVSAVLLGAQAFAQAVVPAPAAGTVGAELRQMASQAGVIFAGQVLAVRPHTSGGMGSGWVEVEFRVDEPIRGCAGQTDYVLREWAGLWTGGRQRYVVGQRALVMLHAPSAAGWSSPVGGQDGVIPLVGVESAPGPEDRATRTTEPTVDLRWVEARVERPVVQGMGAVVATVQKPEQVARSGVEAMRRPRRAGLGLVPGPASTEPPAGANPTARPLRSAFKDGISLRSVMSLLQAWEAGRSDGHP